MTSDLGRVTTYISIYSFVYLYNCGDVRSRTSYNRECCDYLRFTIHCGDVRSRTSYNFKLSLQTLPTVIAVTSDLGRVTTDKYFFPKLNAGIAVTSDLGRVTTPQQVLTFVQDCDCGDVRSRTSYNTIRDNDSTCLALR